MNIWIPEVASNLCPDGDDLYWPTVIEDLCRNKPSEVQTIADLLEALYLADASSCRGDCFYFLNDFVVFRTDEMTLELLGEKRSREFRAEIAANLNPDWGMSWEVQDTLLAFTECPYRDDGEFSESPDPRFAYLSKSGMATLASCLNVSDDHAEAIAKSQKFELLVRLATNVGASADALAECYEQLTFMTDQEERTLVAVAIYFNQSSSHETRDLLEEEFVLDPDRDDIQGMIMWLIDSLDLDENFWPRQDFD